jgi:hypothetical protein
VLSTLAQANADLPQLCLLTHPGPKIPVQCDYDSMFTIHPDVLQSLCTVAPDKASKTWAMVCKTQHIAVRASFLNFDFGHILNTHALKCRENLPYAF